MDQTELNKQQQEAEGEDEEEDLNMYLSSSSVNPKQNCAPSICTNEVYI
jgi:hypothetical protein